MALILAVVVRSTIRVFLVSLLSYAVFACFRLGRRSARRIGGVARRPGVVRHPVAVHRLLRAVSPLSLVVFFFQFPRLFLLFLLLPSLFSPPRRGLRCCPRPFLAFLCLRLSLVCLSLLSSSPSFSSPPPLHFFHQHLPFFFFYLFSFTFFLLCQSARMSALLSISLLLSFLLFPFIFFPSSVAPHTPGVARHVVVAVHAADRDP